VRRLELPPDACPEARRAVAPGILVPVASAGATTEIFGRSVAGSQVAPHREREPFPQGRTEPQPRDAAQQERQAVRAQGAVHSELHPELRDAAEHRVAGPQPAELRQVALQPEAPQPEHPKERQRDAAAEQLQDEQRRERRLAVQPQVQQQARRQQVLERQREL
jgi:hypothetical protein